MKKKLLLSLILTSIYSAEYQLGTIEVTDKIQKTNFTKAITNEELKLHNSDTIKDALSKNSGITLGNVGYRNEGTIYIRGFETKQIGVFVDGLPIYVPFDGTFDYSRFLTNDLDKIIISKGFSSVLYGANTMGGVINLVTKKPTKELEFDIGSKVNFDSKVHQNRYNLYTNIGSKINNFYFQIGATKSKQDYFRLSNNFIPTDLEDGGKREKSDSEDKKLSLKVGYISENGSEFSLGYLNQKAKKSQSPISDSSYDTPVFWDWPMWDKDSIYSISKINLNDGYIKIRAYYDSYENILKSFDDFSFSTQNNFWTFSSMYDDYTYGASIEFSKKLASHNLKLALHHKQDVHRGYNIKGLKTKDSNYEDKIESIGVEDKFNLTPKLFSILGINYDITEGSKVYDKDIVLSQVTASPKEKAFNPQIGLFYALSESENLKALISKKSHLPTMSERYSRSTKKNLFPNPNLKPEKSLNYEVAYNKTFEDKVFSINLFLSKLTDVIDFVKIDELNDQRENIGNFTHKGVESSIEIFRDDYEIGLNYTYLNIDAKSGTNKSVTLPKHSLFSYIHLFPDEKLSYYLSEEFISSKIQNIKPNFYKIKAYSLTNAKVIYKTLKRLECEVGVNNIFDKNYEIEVGFPEAGREFFLNLSYKF